MIFRNANTEDIDDILDIVEQARRSLISLGIDQWQDGYPDRAVFERDIAGKNCYVAETGGRIVGLVSVIFGIEPGYLNISGPGWLTTDEPYLTVHRMAVAEGHRRRGIASAMLDEIKKIAADNSIRSLRIDTHHGNTYMLKLIEKSGFTYCGDVVYDHILRGDKTRAAYEMIVS